MKQYSTVQDVIYILKKGKRLGASKDVPEGKRYIRISDTLANEMANILEKHWENLYGG